MPIIFEIWHVYVKWANLEQVLRISWEILRNCETNEFSVRIAISVINREALMLLQNVLSIVHLGQRGPSDQLENGQLERTYWYTIWSHYSWFRVSSDFIVDTSVGKRRAGAPKVWKMGPSLPLKTRGKYIVRWIGRIADPSPCLKISSYATVECMDKYFFLFYRASRVKTISTIY